MDDECEHDIISGMIQKHLPDIRCVPLTDYYAWVMDPSTPIVLTGFYDDVVAGALGYACMPLEKRRIPFGLLNCDCAIIMKKSDPVLDRLQKIHESQGAYRLWTNINGRHTKAAELPIRVREPITYPAAVTFACGRVSYKVRKGDERWRRKNTCRDTTEWMPLDIHQRLTAQIAHEITPKEFQSIVVTAAKYHDIGKSHPRFQDFLLQGLSGAERAERSHITWAKRRPHIHLAPTTYAHDLTGACAFANANPGKILEAYLIMTHHGRYYDHIPDVADVLPAAAGVGSGRADMTGERWQRDVSDAVYRQYGVFIPAYLEALLRIADMRASDE